MDDIFHPDNPKREDRLKNIGAQMDEQVRLLVDDSEEIATLSDEITSKLQYFEQLCQKVLALIPQQNEALIKRLKELISTIQNIKQYLEVEMQGVQTLKVSKYLLQLIGSIAVTYVGSKYATKVLKNAYIKRLIGKESAEVAGGVMRSSLVVKFPRWVKLGGKVGGFLGGALFAIGVDLAFGAIFGSIKKGQLQDLIKESLDCRYYSTQAKLVNQIVVKCFIEVKGKIQGGSVVLELAEKYMKEGKQEIAYDLLAGLDLDALLDQAKEDVSKVDEAAVLAEIKKIDDGAWKDDFEGSWKPLSEEEFFAKYPPPADE